MCIRDRMENFYRLKETGCGLLYHKGDEFSIYGPLNLIDKILDIGKSGLQINRYKGLGEMNPDELWSTTLDPETRNLLQVQYSNNSQKDQYLIQTLMWSDVSSRKDFIVDNAINVSNLDI